jgi:hypothetical protein
MGDDAVLGTRQLKTSPITKVIERWRADGKPSGEYTAPGKPPGRRDAKL